MNKDILKFHNSKDINYKNSFRIKYYLGNVNKNITIKEITDKIILFDDTNLLKQTSKEQICNELQKLFDCYIKLTHYFNPSYTQFIGYYTDLNNYLNMYKKKSKQDNINCLFYFGDNTSFKKLPCFIKAKTINNNDFSVLLKLNTTRHIGMLNNVKNEDIPFNMKKNKMLWRGTSTGGNHNKQRHNLVNKFYNTKNPNIDIKYSYLCQNVNAPKEQVDKEMSYKEMLKYKFIISIEGNDVATNLKWLLLSNSVAIMPIPKKCSWFMEDTLIPMFHFVPVKDDFSDLEDKFNWCLNNLKTCEEISKNATKYMEQFLDERNEEYITNEVISSYFKYVKFI
jgi:hypothetical protein